MKTKFKRVCQWCTRDEVHGTLEHDTFNGRTKLELCVPCLASNMLRLPYQHEQPRLNGRSMSTEEVKAAVATLPKTKKCSECGDSIVGSHWHFWGQGLNGKPADRGGRVYFCDVECCPLCEAEDPWEEDDDDFVFEDDDDFVFGSEDEDDDDFVFD